jgi:ABC-type lipoprotein export system ATPase subunit
VFLLHRLRSSKTIIVVAHSAAMKAAADVVHEIANGTLLH